MQEISNKTLSFLIIAAVIISFSGTFVSLNRLGKLNYLTDAQPESVTGFATDSGRVNLTILSLVGCQNNANVDFGAGQPSSTGAINITTDAVVNYGFRDCTVVGTTECTGLEIENVGNSPINISINSSVTSENFFDLSGNVSFWGEQGNRTDEETDSCRNITGAYKLEHGVHGIGNQTYLTTSNTLLCYNLTDNIGSVNNDTITVEFNVTIPQDETPGEKNATITITCLEI